MSFKKVLVTGANGQLGKCLKELAKDQSNNHYHFIFKSFQELDISDSKKVTTLFQKEQFDCCINCAAYTNVDNAEKEPDEAEKVNVFGVRNLAMACKNSGATLVHISTDFVFDGESNLPYSEMDTTNPLGVYGKTKLEGEKGIAEILESHIIIRTSWLYSEYGSNFMKTMLHLANANDEISIVNDQLGSPTYAADLANVVLQILKEPNPTYGLYHFSNSGITSWFEFAQKIYELSDIKIKTFPISTEEYPTLAKRPKFSALDSTKIKSVFGVHLKPWQESLHTALFQLKKSNN
ncbi:dTDP-4-dehydrorhamnose reductase [Croceivirga thetidis]|uniref:dTDP-4-dehydrorhamnose reductase n=1 Tax=Croceivirga thetidis TaxID=2721623 RepID=A0ABX1GLC7_9FLAO|nr:dTDP-4-dehydrorhamnose reductase [Croceivirga thetidis]NKI30710.1 dTDP-4-dehydrorhamnose reductase [Croceivirga thetidis]